MGQTELETDPAWAGFDRNRLRRIDRHLARYVDNGCLPGWLIMISRNGRLAHVSAYGWRDIEANLPVDADTVWRLYSMTKLITSVAAMMLYEEGAFQLTDPVAEFIPSFADVRVWAGGSDAEPRTVPAVEPVRIWHLLTHTSGLTYGWHRVHPVDGLYRAAGFDQDWPPGMTLERVCDTLAGIPLMFQPGTEWAYSASFDVLGRVVELVSGQRLDEFLPARIFGPLGMTRTGFHVPAGRLSQLATLYGLNADGEMERLETLGTLGRHPPSMLSGGGGLVSSAQDYHRFTEMLLDLPVSPAGELNGNRLLSPRTVRYMARNHLPAGADVDTFRSRVFTEPPLRGIGFGLGFAVLLDPVSGKVLGSPGELSRGGAANTACWIDQAEQLTVTFWTQLMPTNEPLRAQLRQLVYQALT